MLKPRVNIFSSQEAKISKIKLKDGRNYTVRGDRHRIIFPDEWQAFTDCLRSKRQKVMFNFLINTGCRIDEARHVKIQDIDFMRNSLVIRVTKSRNPDGSMKPRVIPVSTQFSKWLKKYVAENNLSGEDTFRIPQTSPANIALRKGLRKVGIKDYRAVSIHNIRKSLEVWLLSLGVDSLRLSKHFSHSIQVMGQFYVSSEAFNYEDKMKMREIIGDLYKPQQMV